MKHDCQYHCGDKITHRWHTFIFCFCRTAKVSHTNKFYSNPRFRGGDRIFRTLLLEYRCQLLNLLTVAIHIINPVDKTKLSYMLKACVPNCYQLLKHSIFWSSKICFHMQQAQFSPLSRVRSTVLERTQYSSNIQTQN